MIRAVIFDMWDTIIPSTVDFKRLISLLKLEHVPRSEFISRFERSVQLKKYKTFSELHRDFLKEFNKVNSNFFEEEFRLVYCGRVKRHYFFPEAIEVLLSLRKKGYKLGLLSNTENLITQKIEKELSLKKYFDSLCYSFDIGAIKPSKKMYSSVLKKLNVKPGEALMVGDSLRADILGSKKAGLHNCLINRSGSKLDYSVVRPEFEIKSLIELDSVLGELDG